MPGHLGLWHNGHFSAVHCGTEVDQYPSGSRQFMMASQMKKKTKRGNALVESKCFKSVYAFFLLFFEKSGIHGLFYFAQTYILLIERFFWLCLVVTAFISTIILSLQSLRRYETKSTVVTIERDHYYWNTTLPSLTICPTQDRIDKDKFDEYCR